MGGTSDTVRFRHIGALRRLSARASDRTGYRHTMSRWILAAALLAPFAALVAAANAVTPIPTATLVAQNPYPTYTPSKTCVGDCNGDAQVTPDDLVTLVDIALRDITCSVCVPCFVCTVPTIGVTCPVAIDQIITGVNNALNECHFD